MLRALPWKTGSMRMQKSMAVLGTLAALQESSGNSQVFKTAQGRQVAVLERRRFVGKTAKPQARGTAGRYGEYARRGSLGPSSFRCRYSSPKTRVLSSLVTGEVISSESNCTWTRASPGCIPFARTRNVVSALGARRGSSWN
jgi:hypothetical protein